MRNRSILWRSSRGAGLLIVVTLLICVQQLAPRCPAQSKSIPNCGNSTVADAYGPAFASRSEAFLARLQSIVRANDKAKFTNLVHYPIQVSWGSRDITIKDRSDFIRNYRLILTPELKKAILFQNPKCLFANEQGVMIGHGQLWFYEEPDKSMKIITITLGFPSSGR